MPPGRYIRPPITEAVIEVRYQAPMDNETIDKLKRKLSRDFPRVEDRLEVAVEVGGGEAKLSGKADGFKASKLDGLDIVLVSSINIANCRLAPYPGWASFRERTINVWQVVRESVGYRAIKRLGIRFLNRLDVPGNEIDLSQYLNVGFRMPEALSAVSNQYFVEMRLPLADDDFVHIRTGTIEPAIPNHGSLLLDIDVYNETRVPQIDEELWKFADRLRDVKNRVFEACITDASRQLFDRPLEG